MPIDSEYGVLDLRLARLYSVHRPPIYPDPGQLSLQERTRTPSSSRKFQLLIAQEVTPQFSPPLLSEAKESLMTIHLRTL